MRKGAYISQLIFSYRICSEGSGEPVDCESSLLCGVKQDLIKETYFCEWWRENPEKELEHEKTKIVGLSEENVSQWNEHPRVHPEQPPALGCVSFSHRNPIILHFGVSTLLAMQHP